MDWSARKRRETVLKAQLDQRHLWSIKYLPAACSAIDLHRFVVEYFSLNSTGRKEDDHQHCFGPGAHRLIIPNLEISASVF